MIIGLLDPALFSDDRDIKEIEKSFDEILSACRRYNVVLPPLEEYWSDITKYTRPLRQKLNSDAKAKRALDELLKLSEYSDLAWKKGFPPEPDDPDLFVVGEYPCDKQTKPSDKKTKPNPPEPAEKDRAWDKGFSQLFSVGATPKVAVCCKVMMAKAAIRALSPDINGNCHRVVLFTRRILGRNLNRHSVGENNNCLLEENTRWVLYLQPKGQQEVKTVACIYHHRNLDKEWSTRFDWQLPSEGDYPFCPPADWCKSSVQAWRTSNSKPAWIDRYGSGWVRPNNNDGGLGNHWDVFLSESKIEENELNSINVSQYGFKGDPKHGSEGNIHHTPEEKKSIRKPKDWSCR